MKIASCYYPTTVVAIDDDQRVLNGLKVNIEETLPCMTFNSSEQALHFLTHEYQPNPFTQRVLLRPEQIALEHRAIDIDIRAIHREIYNPKRFSEISVVIVDYAMPGLNGAELCKRLKGLPYKKIMLTGEGTHDLAVNLFNEGIIDKFILKSSTATLMQNVIAAVEEMQHRYFLDLSEVIITSLTKDPNYTPAYLDDPAFVALFHQVKQQIKAVEYYLMDGFGSFFFLDTAGRPSWLAVQNELEMQGWTETGEDGPAEIVKSMQQREKILYLHTDEDFQKHPAEWQSYLHPAKQLQGRELYYYALITGKQVYDIKPDQILAYNSYLASLP